MRRVGNTLPSGTRQQPARPRRQPAVLSRGSLGCGMADGLVAPAVPLGSPGSAELGSGSIRMTCRHPQPRACARTPMSTAVELRERYPPRGRLQMPRGRCRPTVDHGILGAAAGLAAEAEAGPALSTKQVTISRGRWLPVARKTTPRRRPKAWATGAGAGFGSGSAGGCRRTRPRGPRGASSVGFEEGHDDPAVRRLVAGRPIPDDSALRHHPRWSPRLRQIDRYSGRHRRKPVTKVIQPPLRLRRATAGS